MMNHVAPNGAIPAENSNLPNQNLIEKLLRIQAYTVIYKEEEITINDHELATPDFTREHSYGSFFHHSGGLSLMQWSSLLGDMVSFYEMVVTDLKKQTASKRSVVYKTYKSRTMEQVFPNSTRSSTDNKKALSDSLVNAILDDQTDTDELVVAYREKLTSLDEAKYILGKLRHSQKICEISFQAIRSFGATERQFANSRYSFD